MTLSNATQQLLDPADIVVFGGSGDLALRKIVQALYYRMQAGQFHPDSRVFLLGRQSLTAEEHRAILLKACREFIKPKDFNDADFTRLADRTRYLDLDATNAADFIKLAEALNDEAHTIRVFYLSTPANLFGPICEHLKANQLITHDARVVLEKPIGHDLASFHAINQAVLSCFSEEQVYRIDHYLGKETVQNLMVLRFGNALFEHLWNAEAIDHVQITVAESIGVGERFSYYDSYGALRDMVQNHLLQMLCLLAMEPPAFLRSDTVRDEKLKVLRALRPITAATASECTVRGQYAAGDMGGEAVGSYRDDIKGHPSVTETFVALKAHVDNWRWSGVPFYLRTGKRMKERYSEIVVQFRSVPINVFPAPSHFPETNKLVLRLQPDEYIRLQMNTKVPGPGGYRMKPVNLDLSLSEAFGERAPDAYERLLMDVVRGNPILFMRTDEVEAAWHWTETILSSWEDAGMGVRPYAAGSWGPDASDALLTNDGRSWYRHHEASGDVS